MAFKGVLSVVFVCLFGLGSATSCLKDGDCDTWSDETCCSDYVCRETCIYCSYNYQCGTGEECCNGDCKSYCTYSTTTPRPIVCSYDYQCGTGEECCDGYCLSYCSYYSTTWTGGSIAGAVVGTIVFFAIIISIVSCCCCACCPYSRYRTPATVVVAQGGTPCQPFVSTVSTTQSSQQNMQQFPPPGNYPPPPGPPGNYPPPPGNYNQPPPGYNQPPPAYPSYPQYPQGQAQVSMPPPVSAGQPVGKH